MTAPSSDDPRPADGSLKHNPFAALRGKVREVSAKPEPSGAGPNAAPESVSPSASRSNHEKRGRVTVRRERAGRGGKTVTIADGPGLAGRDLAKLAREAASALGL